MQLDQVESEHFSYLPSETQMETLEKDCTETKLRMKWKASLFTVGFVLPFARVSHR